MLFRVIFLLKIKLLVNVLINTIGKVKIFLL